MFLELHSYFTNKSFNTWIDQERNLMLYQPPYLIKEDKWKIVPFTDDAKSVNEFYNKFTEGIEGTKQECLEQIKNYRV
jgi:hypothetical protein